MQHVHYRDEGYVCATWGPVIVNVCHKSITLEALAAGRRAGDELESRHGAKLGVITVISAEMSMPSDAVRKQAGLDMHASAPRVAASTTVISGQGFRASAMRMAYSSLALFSRSSAMSRVSDDVAAAVQYVGDALALDADARRQLEAFVEGQVESLSLGAEAEA